MSQNSGKKPMSQYKDKIAFLGCGEYPMQGAVNVDIRPLPGVDVVADVKNLPFGDGELEGAASRNLIEHFDRFEVKEVVKEWSRVVKKGGFIQIETVDMGEAMSKWKEIPTENLLDCMYGAQTYPENYHKMLMTEEILTDLFKEAGMEAERIERFEHRQIPRIKILFVKL